MNKHTLTLSLAAILVVAVPTISRAMTPEETHQLAALAAKRWTEKFPGVHILEHKMMSGPQAPQAGCTRVREVDDPRVGLDHVLWKCPRGDASSREKETPEVPAS